MNPGVFTSGFAAAASAAAQSWIPESATCSALRMPAWIPAMSHTGPQVPSRR